MNNKFNISLAMAMTMFLLAATSANAGWSVTSLSGSPWASGMYAGMCLNASVTAYYQPEDLASLSCSWTAPSLSPVVDGKPLCWPTGCSECGISLISGGSIVGGAVIGNSVQLGFWDIATGDWTVLSQSIGRLSPWPTGACGSDVTGMLRLPNDTVHACVWHGTSGSCVDLNPGSQFSSSAMGVYNGWVVGFVQTGSDESSYRASLWNGSSAHWVDLGPGEALGIYKDQVVGIGPSTACVWNNALSGTAVTESILTPGPFTHDDGDYAQPVVIYDGVQAGYVETVTLYPKYESQSYYAAVWKGPSEVFVNLDSLLPAHPSYGDYCGSTVTGLWASDSGEIWVSGYGTYAGSVLWHFVPGISGTVALSNYVGDVTQVPVTVEIQSTSSTTAIETDTISLDSAGNYSFIPTTQGLSGAYNVVAKASHWLAQCVPTVLDTDGSGVASFSLINGDVNGDNFIEDQDYSLLGVSWYSAVGDANYNVNADLNGDGFVEDQDYSIMGMNWYASGDPF